MGDQKTGHTRRDQYAMSMSQLDLMQLRSNAQIRRPPWRPLLPCLLHSPTLLPQLARLLLPAPPRLTQPQRLERLWVADEDGS